jgi:hypothetical protein
MARFNKDQTELKSESLPLIDNFLRKNPEIDKETIFPTNRITRSKSEEWFILECLDTFVVLVHAESRQAKELLTVIEECKDAQCALVVQYCKSSKSRVLIGVDEECPVYWSPPKNDDPETAVAYFCYQKATHPYTELFKKIKPNTIHPVTPKTQNTGRLSKVKKQQDNATSP